MQAAVATPVPRRDGRSVRPVSPLSSRDHLPGLGLVVGAGAGLVLSGWVLVGAVGPASAICAGAALGLVAGAAARHLMTPGDASPARR